jgi:Ice-binding-like/Bacterial Ig-like domain
MRNSNFRKFWIPAFLLTAVVIAGCGDGDKNSGGATSPLAAPTVITVTPPDGSTLVCPNIAVITATFSKDMNPATINSPATTFTVSGPGGNVSGTVNYVVTTRVATFTVSTALTASTPFTATISTGVADTFGNHLAANKVWTFTTSAPCNSPGAIPLGTACSFGILGATPVVSSTGPTHVTGDIGISPALSITGFPPGTLTGAEFMGATSLAGTAQNDLTTAYNAAMNTPGGQAIPADIGNLPRVFPPGVYKATTTLGITGDLTLDGSTNPNGSWIFQVGSALTTAAGTTGGVPNSRVILVGGAKQQNVYWQMGSAATLGTSSIFAGTIMAQTDIVLGTGATLNGRALARTGQVNLDSNPVNVLCP